MDDSPARNTRARAKKMATDSPSSSPTTSTFDEATPELFRTTTTTTTTTNPNTTKPRNPPFLPTPIEAALLLAYPVLLTFGTLFSLLNPTVRNAAYDPAQQAHVQDASLSPSYFARKSNVFNVFFVKRGWAWITIAFFVFLFTHPATAAGGLRARARGLVRWGLVTSWWVLVTQWCFGPALIDRSFRFTGGKCEVADARIEEGEAGGKDFVTGLACKAAGGRWSGGHDISGHVFLLVLGSYFLLQEVGWAYLNHWQRRAGGGAVVSVRDERSVVMHDGAVKSAAVEGERYLGGVEGRAMTAWEALGLGGKVAGGVVVMSWWMILMTAIYFHTWIEKLTGLLVALMGLYTVYILPRFVPALREIVGLPGV
ncbi:FIT family protein scs3 [Cytospora mali]|uniref:Acyl-coenzyme A diphosphatase SCS3 n=1 Tax=Cytospora mali TaxID=578113 RepID=A0A194VN77_CYTMA|nr:FIT family protein scs3 [Valsa mali]